MRLDNGEGMPKHSTLKSIFYSFFCRANDYDLYTNVLFESSDASCNATCINNATNMTTSGRNINLLSDDGSVTEATVVSPPTSVSGTLIAFGNHRSIRISYFSEIPTDPTSTNVQQGNGRYSTMP